MNNVNEGWRSVRALMLLTGLALCASAFAADPTPAAAGAVATPDAAVAAAPESAPDATADNGAAPVRFLVMANQKARYQAWWPGACRRSTLSWAIRSRQANCW